MIFVDCGVVFVNGDVGDVLIFGNWVDWVVVSVVMGCNCDLFWWWIIMLFGLIIGEFFWVDCGLVWVGCFLCWILLWIFCYCMGNDWGIDLLFDGRDLLIDVGLVLWCDLFGVLFVLWRWLMFDFVSWFVWVDSRIVLFDGFVVYVFGVSYFLLCGVWYWNWNFFECFFSCRIIWIFWWWVMGGVMWVVNFG